MPSSLVNSDLRALILKHLNVATARLLRAFLKPRSSLKWVTKLKILEGECLKIQFLHTFKTLDTKNHKIKYVILKFGEFLQI